MAKPFEARLLLGYTIAITTAHAQCQHMWPSLCAKEWQYVKS